MCCKQGPCNVYYCEVILSAVVTRYWENRVHEAGRFQLCCIPYGIVFKIETILFIQVNISLPVSFHAFVFKPNYLAVQLTTFHSLAAAGSVAIHHVTSFMRDQLKMVYCFYAPSSLCGTSVWPLVNLFLWLLMYAAHKDVEITLLRAVYCVLCVCVGNILLQKANIHFSYKI